MAGLFISLEGIEGAGKSTQAKLLTKYLKDIGLRCVLTREPGATTIGKKIRKILLSPTNENFPSIAELFLYEADRNIHINNIINPALRENKVVICDRFIDSTLAYQGYARNLDKEIIEKLNKLATNGLKPDITFVFDIPVEKSQQRVGKNKDRIEQESLEFHKKLREGFLDIAKKEPKRVFVIDSNKKPKEIFDSIITILQNKGFVLA